MLLELLAGAFLSADFHALWTTRVTECYAADTCETARSFGLVFSQDFPSTPFTLQAVYTPKLEVLLSGRTDSQDASDLLRCGVSMRYRVHDH